VRSTDGWVKSMENTISQVFFGDTLLHHLSRAQYNIDPNYAADIETLGETVRRRVRENSGVELEWEIKRIGTA